MSTKRKATEAAGVSSKKPKTGVGGTAKSTRRSAVKQVSVAASQPGEDQNDEIARLTSSNAPASPSASVGSNTSALVHSVQGHQSTHSNIIHTKHRKLTESQMLQKEWSDEAFDMNRVATLRSHDAFSTRSKSGDLPSQHVPQIATKKNGHNNANAPLSRKQSNDSHRHYGHSSSSLAGSTQSKETGAASNLPVLHQAQNATAPPAAFAAPVATAHDTQPAANVAAEGGGNGDADPPAADANGQPQPSPSNGGYFFMFCIIPVLLAVALQCNASFLSTVRSGLGIVKFGSVGPSATLLGSGMHQRPAAMHEIPAELLEAQRQMHILEEQVDEVLLNQSSEIQALELQIRCYNESRQAEAQRIEQLKQAREREAQQAVREYQEINEALVKQSEVLMETLLDIAEPTVRVTVREEDVVVDGEVQGVKLTPVVRDDANEEDTSDRVLHFVQEHAPFLHSSSLPIDPPRSVAEVQRAIREQTVMNGELLDAVVQKLQELDHAAAETEYLTSKHRAEAHQLLQDNPELVLRIPGGAQGKVEWVDVSSDKHSATPLSIPTGRLVDGLTDREKSLNHAVQAQSIIANYASIGRGGRIKAGKCYVPAEQQGFLNRMERVLGKKSLENCNANTILSSHIVPHYKGYFRKSGSGGDLEITTAEPIRIFAMEIAHVVDVAGDEEQASRNECGLRSAIKDFSLTANIREFSLTTSYALGSYTFLPMDVPAEDVEYHREVDGEGHFLEYEVRSETFDISPPAVSLATIPPSKSFSFHIASNHGAPEYTCIYRISIFGSL